MSERSAKLRLGGFVAVGLAGVAALAILFGGAPRVFDNRVKYIVTFGEAPGVTPGTPVRKSGVRIGEVSAIDLDEDSSQVKVTILVDKRYLPRQNEDATVFRGILSGDTSLDFIPKTTPDGLPTLAKGDVYPINTVIGGQTPINPNTFVRQASGVLPSAQESMARMLNSIERFEKAVPKIEKAFDEIASLAKTGREFVPELRKTNDKVQSLLSFNDLIGGADNLAVANIPQGIAQEKPLGPNNNDGGLKSTLNDVRDLIKTAKPLVEEFRKLIKDNEGDITGTLKAVRKTAESANDLLSDTNKKNIAGILKNLDTATDDLSKSIRLVGIFLDQGEKTLKEFNSRWPKVDSVVNSTESAVKAAEVTFKSAAGAVRNIEMASKPIAENADQIVKNINVTSEQLARTLAEVRETLRAVNRSDGTLQKVITDPALYNQLNESAVALTRTLMRAEKIATDLQVFADKVARRPETIGVGGVLRPSGGLKESPTASTPERPILPTPLPPNPQPVGPVVPAFRPTGMPRIPSDLPSK
jgi:phospholipid/cholesterol/gamma-HCH transport system substrate-binding protein